MLAHHSVVRDGLARWHGVENDTAGDGFYATFDGPARAIRCVSEIIDRVRDLGIQIRAGVHTGECELIDGKAGGLAVSIGARVAAKAGASEVMVSQTVKDLVAGSGLAFEDAGEHELKGVPDLWRLYRVREKVTFPPKTSRIESDATGGRWCARVMLAGGRRRSGSRSGVGEARP